MATHSVLTHPSTIFFFSFSVGNTCTHTLSLLYFTPLCQPAVFWPVFHPSSCSYPSCGGNIYMYVQYVQGGLGYFFCSYLSCMSEIWLYKYEFSFSCSRAAPSAEFSVDRTRHLMSFLTMLGPSPDWNVGLSSEDLCTRECGWVQKVVQDLIPWDAGTDSGVTYEVSAHAVGSKRHFCLAFCLFHIEFVITDDIQFE